jgi:hypothetical protein
MMVDLAIVSRGSGFLQGFSSDDRVEDVFCCPCGWVGSGAHVTGGASLGGSKSSSIALRCKRSGMTSENHASHVWRLIKVYDIRRTLRRNQPTAYCQIWQKCYKLPLGRRVSHSGTKAPKSSKMIYMQGVNTPPRKSAPVVLQCAP